MSAQFNNPNEIFDQLNKMTKNISEGLGKATSDIQKSFGVDKKYNFKMDGKDAAIIVFKNKSMSLAIEGVNDEYVKALIKRLSDD